MATRHGLPFCLVGSEDDDNARARKSVDDGNQLPSEGAALIEKLEKYAHGDVRSAVVLATPDDEGNAQGRADERKNRARQNVVL